FGLSALALRGVLSVGGRARVLFSRAPQAGRGVAGATRRLIGLRIGAAPRQSAIRNPQSYASRLFHSASPQQIRDRRLQLGAFTLSREGRGDFRLRRRGG